MLTRTRQIDGTGTAIPNVSITSGDRIMTSSTAFLLPNLWQQSVLMMNSPPQKKHLHMVALEVLPHLILIIHLQCLMDLLHTTDLQQLRALAPQ